MKTNTLFSLVGLLVIIMLVVLMLSQFPFYLFQ